MADKPSPPAPNGPESSLWPIRPDQEETMRYLRDERGRDIPAEVRHYIADDIEGRTNEQKQPGQNYVPLGGAGNGA